MIHLDGFKLSIELYIHTALWNIVIISTWTCYSTKWSRRRVQGSISISAQLYHPEQVENTLCCDCAPNWGSSLLPSSVSNRWRHRRTRAVGRNSNSSSRTSRSAPRPSPSVSTRHTVGSVAVEGDLRASSCMYRYTHIGTYHLIFVYISDIFNIVVRVSKTTTTGRGICSYSWVGLTLFLHLTQLLSQIKF